MTDKTALRQLIEAVEAGIDVPDIGHGFWQILPNPGCHFAARAYLGSLDAAKALHEALLPEFDWERSDGWMFVSSCDYYERAKVIFNPARAWLISILKAYEAQQ